MPASSSPLHQVKPDIISLEMIQFLSSRSRKYMNLSMHFLHKNYIHVSLFLCNRALEYMVVAFYIKQMKRWPDSISLQDDILLAASKDSMLSIDSLIFIHSISFLSREESLLSKANSSQILRLIKKADELLFQISSQLGLPPSESNYTDFNVRQPKAANAKPFLPRRLGACYCCQAVPSLGLFGLYVQIGCSLYSRKMRSTSAGSVITPEPLKLVRLFLP